MPKTDETGSEPKSKGPTIPATEGETPVDKLMGLQTQGLEAAEEADDDTQEVEVKLHVMADDGGPVPVPAIEHHVLDAIECSGLTQVNVAF